MEFRDIDAPVSREEALTADCPACGSATGVMCVHTADKRVPRRDSGWWEPRVIVYRAGEVMERVHNQRKMVIRERRLRAYRRTRRSPGRPSPPPSPEIRASIAAMRAWDLAEYEKLRDWLADWGWLLAEADRPKRPDGTLRGESYAFGQD